MATEKDLLDFINQAADRVGNQRVFVAAEQIRQMAEETLKAKPTPTEENLCLCIFNLCDIVQHLLGPKVPTFATIQEAVEFVQKKQQST